MLDINVRNGRYLCVHIAKRVYFTIQTRKYRI